jgi:hypothetical protein
VERVLLDADQVLEQDLVKQKCEVSDGLLTSPGGVLMGIVVVNCAALKSAKLNGLKVAPHSAI